MRIKKDDMVAAVGGRLKYIRQGLHLNQTEMAQKLGLSQSAYYKKECGYTLPGIFTLLYLHDKMNISLDWLLLGRGPVYYRDKQMVSRELKEKANNLKNDLPEFLKLLDTLA